MNTDTLLVSLSLLPRSMRVHIQNLVAFANDIDSTATILEGRIIKQTSPNQQISGVADSQKQPVRNSSNTQDDLSKLIRSLRRLYLCMSDLFDMLKNCVEIHDSVKRKSIYIQIEPSIALIKNTLVDIREHYADQLLREGINLSFADVDSALDEFVAGVRKERERIGEGKPLSHHPNILMIITSGLSHREIEESINRYIPRSEIFPCDDRALSQLETPCIRPSSPGILDWDEEELYDVDMDSPVHSATRPSSPSIGQPVRFPNIAHFARSGMLLRHHYNAAGGECPGRATLLTGQLPPIHGVRTSLEKTGERSELKVEDVPTLGHYFAAAGYDVVYKGEWGLSQLQALQEHPLLDLLGVEREADEDLQPFGFQNWEVHKEGDWYERSLQTTSEAVDFIRRRENVISNQGLRGSQPPPWVLVVSYPDVLPDIKTIQDSQAVPLASEPVSVSSGVISKSLSFGNLRKIDSIRQTEIDSSIKGKELHVLSILEKQLQIPEQNIPSVQKLYRNHCTHNQSSLEHHYIQNSKQLDSLLGELFQEIARCNNNNTVILFTSVAGNLKGEHQMWGCCYNGYEESIRVPCVVQIPSTLPLHQRLSREIETNMTSSIDILPTLLHIAGINRSEVQSHLRNTHRKIPALIGRDLCETAENELEVVYYQNEDVAMPIPKYLPQAESAGKVASEKVAQRSITAVVARVRLGDEMKRFKLCYYSSDPRSCVHLPAVDDKAYPCELELYDLDNDPSENHNIVEEAQWREILERMKELLRVKHQEYCNLNDVKKEKETSKELYLFSWKSPNTTREVKWRQFYILVIAFVVSIVAMIIRYFLSY